MDGLGLKDKKLLYWLDQDSRSSNKMLGKRVGLTEQAIGNKIRKLQSDGVIKKFVTFINTVSLGYTHYRVFLKLYNMDIESEKEIIKLLVKNSNVRWVASISGKYDLSFSVLAKDSVDFLNIYSKIEKEKGRDIIEKNILVNAFSPGFSRGYLLGKKTSKMMEYGVAKEVKKIDHIDGKILRSISQDSRKKIIDIARETKTTVDIVKYRLKKLRHNGIISGFTIQMGLDKIGYEFYSILLYTSYVDNNILERLCKFALQNSNILFVARHLGSWEYEVLFEVKNYTEFEKILRDLRIKFSDEIRNIEILRLIKEYKYDFFPFVVD